MNEPTEVKVTGGVGWFFFALIPGAIAGALLMYFAFYTGVIDWQKQQRVQSRMDNRVGVNGELKSPVDLIVIKRSCVTVDRAFLDGTTGTMYLTNKCNGFLHYFEWHENAVAPDGTIIWRNYSNSINGLEVGNKVEVNFSAPDDPRIAKIIVWAEGKSEGSTQ